MEPAMPPLPAPTFRCPSPDEASRKAPCPSLVGAQHSPLPPLLDPPLRPPPPHLGVHHGSAGSQTVGGGASRCGHDEAITLHEEKSVAKKSGRTTL